MRNLRTLTTSLFIIGLAAAAVSSSDPSTLRFNDSTASTDVVMKNGHAYVPVSAVAKLLNATVVAEGSTFKFVPLDNSRQVNGNEGKVGEMVRLGYSNITVTKVDSGATYKAKFGGSDFTADAGKKVVAIDIHIQNSTLKQQLCPVLGGDKTALADTMGRSYTASSFSDFQARAVDLLPGAATDFTLVFNVPADIELKDLVYEVVFQAMSTFKTARIHLQ